MPKAGFKSITVSETIYDKFMATYQASKNELAMKGVNSFAGYVTYMLENLMAKDKIFAKYAPKIEKISVDLERVILKDNQANRIAELSFIKNKLHCQLCDADDCIHVGFCYDLPEVYEVIGKR